MQLLSSQKKETPEEGKIQGKDATAQHRCVRGKDVSRGSPGAVVSKELFALTGRSTRWRTGTKCWDLDSQEEVTYSK